MIHLIGLLGQACAKPQVGSANNSATTASRKIEDGRMLFLLLIVGMNEVSHRRIGAESRWAMECAILRRCFFIHGNRADHANRITFCATATTILVVHHGNFSPSLLFKGKKSQVAGGNAPSTSGTTCSINVWNLGCHRKEYIGSVIQS